MTKEEKQLLLITLCEMMPWGVICEDMEGKTRPLFGITPTQHFIVTLDNVIDGTKGLKFCTIDCVKPYLRPMESMTEEEKKEFIKVSGYDIEESINGRHYEYYLKDSCVGTPNEPTANYDAVDWLNKNYFNYRNLPEHLYIKVTKENNPYKK